MLDLLPGSAWLCGLALVLGRLPNGRVAWALGRDGRGLLNGWSETLCSNEFLPPIADFLVRKLNIVSNSGPGVLVCTLSRLVEWNKSLVLPV